MKGLKLTSKLDRVVILEHQMTGTSLPCAMIDVEGHTGAIVVFALQQATATTRAKQIVRALKAWELRVQQEENRRARLRRRHRRRIREGR